MNYDPTLSRDLIAAIDKYGDKSTHAERALRNQLQAADDEVARLAKWKREQLEVSAWWSTLEDYVRKHREARLGQNVSAIALRWLQERDELRAQLERLRAILNHQPSALPGLI